MTSVTNSVKIELLLCYNKGCGSKFKLENNSEDACCFHPGTPIFHDAYKGWSCCSKRSTDFTTFLNTQGCTKGKHNPVKPEEPVKQKPDPTTKDEVITVSAPKEVFLTRPNFGSKMERLKVTVTQSLKDGLNKKKENQGKHDDFENSLTIKVGELCKNNGCNASYEGEHSNLEICKYHPGVPIFHEGLKFWHCCQRRTTDFDVFLQQEGCSTGSHFWFKKDLRKTDCRFDWHQTATHTFVTVYAKYSLPELSQIDANPVRLKAKIAFDDNQEFDVDNELGGIIVPNESNVTMAATKVEIKLRKAEPKHWTKIFLPPKEEKESMEEKLETKGGDNSTDPELDVDSIDLNDI